MSIKGQILIQSIHYEVSVLSRTEHLLEVKMHISTQQGTDSKLPILLALPSWIPGSYMIRDFARNLHNIHCEQREISLQQQDKQTWKVTTNENSAKKQFPEIITISYCIYAYDLSVRSAFINDEYAFFNGTSVFLCVKTHLDVPHSVEINSNSFYADKDRESSSTTCTWSENQTLDNAAGIATGMPRLKDQNYGGINYYELIDHPFLIGKFSDYCFDVNGHTFHLIFSGENQVDCTKLELDLTPIIEHHLALFEEFPCKDYFFITLICDKGFGGLEHVNSTVLQYSRDGLPVVGETLEKDNAVKSSYQQFLSLCSHELFHTWHVKRIKPLVFHRPNLFEEVYTNQLWIYEGFTSFYDDVSLARAKVISAKQYASVLSETITRYLRTPGRHYQSAATSSFEAWTKFYKQDAGSLNHIVSYYTKGAIIALCLDITIRQLSDNNYSLDDVMKILWKRHGSTQVGTTDKVVEEICKTELDIDVSNFIQMATHSSIELPLSQLLEFIGLELSLRPMQNLQDKGGNLAPEFDVDIGANLSASGEFLIVNNVQTQRSASKAGLIISDKIIAVDGLVCNESSFLNALKNKKEGSFAHLHVLRDGRLIELKFPILKAKPDTCVLNIVSNDKFESWLGI